MTNTQRGARIVFGTTLDTSGADTFGPHLRVDNTDSVYSPGPRDCPLHFHVRKRLEVIAISVTPPMGWQLLTISDPKECDATELRLFVVLAVLRPNLVAFIIE